MQEKDESNIIKFLEYLRRNVADKGMMADLRRGFSAGTEQRAWPYIASWCNLADSKQKVIWLVIAAGFATLGGTDAKAGNMGATLRKIAGSTKDGLKSFEGRFKRLITCHTAEEVCERLPGIIRTAERKSVGVDLELLFWDLVKWGEDSKVKWASVYWGADERSEGGDAE